MKKIAILLSCFLIPKMIFSQSFQEGNLLLKGGIGMSSPYYWKSAEGVIPPLNINVDYALKDKIWCWWYFRIYRIQIHAK